MSNSGGKWLSIQNYSRVAGALRQRRIPECPAVTHQLSVYDAFPDVTVVWKTAHPISVCKTVSWCRVYRLWSCSRCTNFKEGEGIRKGRKRSSGWLEKDEEPEREGEAVWPFSWCERRLCEWVGLLRKTVGMQSGFWNRTWQNHEGTCGRFLKTLVLRQKTGADLHFMNKPCKCLHRHLEGSFYF